MDLPNTAKRQKRLRAQFKEEVIEDMEKAHPDEDLSEWRWCPIVQEYCPELSMRAGHLFPAGATQDTMDAIFGPQEQDMWRDKGATSQLNVKGELFRACNGIYWSKAAVDRFGKGYFVIVPDLDAHCTEAQARAWQESSVKEYRIRVMRPDVLDMQQSLSPYNRTRWYEIDNKRVEWGSPTFRPRARYLYWTYPVALLRNVHDKGEGKGAKGGQQGVATSIAQGQIGRRYWGNAGAYMKKSMLIGFLEELGHAYDEELMEAVMDSESENEPAKLAVFAYHSRNSNSVSFFYIHLP